MCVYVCMYVINVYMCMYLCNVCMSCVYVYVYIYLYVCACVCIYMYMYVMYVCVCMYVCECIYIYICMYVCMYVIHRVHSGVYSTLAASFSGYVSLSVGNFIGACVLCCVVLYIQSTHIDRTVHFVTLLATQLNADSTVQYSRSSFLSDQHEHVFLPRDGARYRGGINKSSAVAFPFTGFDVILLRYVRTFQRQRL